MAVTVDEKWLDAQYSVLGSVLISPEVAPRVMSGTSEKDYSGTCRTVFLAIKKLFLSGAAIDPVSVSGALGPNYRDFLVQLMQITPTAANIDAYITLCREQSRVAAVRELAQKMAVADTSEKLRPLLEKASGLMADKPNLKITTMADALASFMQRHTQKPDYLTWPVRELNDQIYGELGDFFIIAGSPSTGKSAWALQCAWHWAKQYKVGFFSLETSSEKLFDRQMAAAAQINMEVIKRNVLSQSEWDKVCGMNPEITARNLELIPAAGMTPADVRAVTMMRGYQIIFIDYLQLLAASGDNRTAQVTSISIALHTLAQSMGVTVVALSQLARKKEGAPSLSDLRESGQIEQDADMVMILSLEKKDDPSGNRILHVAKNKEGICPKVMLAFDGKHQTFSKANRSGDVLGQMVADGKKAKRKAHQQADPNQMQILPGNTPVPFEQ